MRATSMNSGQNPRGNIRRVDPVCQPDAVRHDSAFPATEDPVTRDSVLTISLGVLFALVPQAAGESDEQ